jgi:hypothetical protein
MTAYGSIHQTLTSATEAVYREFNNAGLKGWST